MLPWVLLALGLACRAPAPAKDPAAGGSQAGPEAANLLFTWEGSVDGRDTLKFRGSECLLEHEAHRPVRQMKFRAVRPIDPTAFPVLIRKEQGRGIIEIIRQGDEFNAFTLVVRVDDQHLGGAGFYKFSAYRDLSRVPERVILSLYAEVDDEAVIEIAGRLVTPRPLGGRGVLSIKYDFPADRPVRPEDRYELRILRGRGEVALLPPGRSPAAVRILILDKDKGSSAYILELIPAR
jgi:hypothetical protein